ncbi:MAG: hypothetical protein GF331_02850 [Chitinivibrionales bacterium]|nr:hypothetical protein [Chitinivibrionales bacterium]
MESKVHDMVVFCSFDTTFADTFFTVTLPADSVVANAVNDTFRVKVRNAQFDGALRTVYCGVVLRSEAGIASSLQRGQFEVGRVLPQNPLDLSASALSSFQVRVSWPSIAASGPDSIRIFVDTVQAPLDVVNVGAVLDTVFATPTQTEVTVTDLSAATRYHFTGQAKIGVDWTAVTTQSRAFATTFTPNPSDSITNTADIDTAYLDTVLNRIVLVWTYDSLGDSAQFGVVHGIDSTTAAGQQPATWYNARLPGDTAYITLGESILFDTTYTLFVRMRKLGGLLAPITTRATEKLRMPGFTWQPITYFETVTGDTAWAFNKHVALWYESGWNFGEFADTVRAVRLSSAPAGLQPVSTGIEFDRYDDGPALSMALRYDSVPPGYRAEDIRVYRRTLEGQWHVYHDYTTIADRGFVVIEESMTSLVGQSLMLMIDTEPPTAQVLSDIDTPVEPSTRLYDTVRVNDNIANVAVTLLYSRGENAASAGFFDTLNGLSGLVAMQIPEGYVTADNGVRAYVVVSDGLHTDTLNISRQVNVLQGSDIMTEAKTWFPLRTTVALDEPAMAGVITNVTGGSYDNTVCRVFRWFDPAAVDDVSDGAHAWVEYQPAKSAVFEIEPCKLMWVKTSTGERLDFGSGVTTSLRDTITVSLPPENWTDIALPYKFDVYLGDVLDATGGHADSLAFYRWNRRSDKVYETDVAYIATLPLDSLRDKATLLSSDTRTGYSIYNKMPVQVTLRIPPTTYVMSSYHGAPRALSKTSGRSGGWAVTLSPRIAEGRRLSTIVLGHTPGEGDRSWYPVSPSFGKVGVRLYDRQSNAVYGHAVEHRLDGGGARFEVQFSNESDDARQILYTLGGLQNVPDSMMVRVIDPVSGAEQDAATALSVTVPAKGRAYRVVSVGNSAYHAGALAMVEPFAQFAAYPNPFRGSIAIRFMLPEEVARLECRLFDAQGRVIWEYVRREGIRTGMNHLVWDGRTLQDRAVSAGMYLLRVSAYGVDGRRLATKEQRLVYMR